MRRITSIFMLSALVLTGCAEKQVKVERLNYSLLDRIYKQIDEKDVKRIESIREEDKQILNVPKYVKIYRGSYSDEDGNVVEGGMELLRIDDGIPDTNF